MTSQIIVNCVRIREEMISKIVFERGPFKRIVSCVCVCVCKLNRALDNEK